MPRPAHNPNQYSKSVSRWQCPVCQKLCKSKSSEVRHIHQKHSTISSEPILLEMQNENLLHPSSPNTIQQIIHTPEIESPMPPVFATGTHLEHESILNELGGLGSSASLSSPSSNNFQELGHNLVSSEPSNRSQRLTTVGSTTYHSTINGK